MALLFFQNLQQPASARSKLAARCRIDAHLQLRMGIHSGPVNQAWM